MTIPIALEVSKPSEQTIKALADPKKVGGSILLFTEPVGRQEYDNLDFLAKHHLIPTDKEMLLLCDQTQSNQVREIAQKWRGIMLPYNAKEAAHFTAHCLATGIFSEPRLWMTTKDHPPC
jgi:hypothetical protein